MRGSGLSLSRRWIVLTLLPAFLSLWLQPQVNTLYHIHRGGEYAHIHAGLPTSPYTSLNDNDHQHDHRHSHPSSHHHAHAASLQHTSPHDSITPSTDKRPQIHREHGPHNGHRHTTVALHWASLDHQEAKSPVFLIHLLRRAVETTIVVSLILAFRSRAPPSLSRVPNIREERTKLRRTPRQEKNRGIGASSRPRS